jgi:hypothetical protein
MKSIRYSLSRLLKTLLLIVVFYFILPVLYASGSNYKEMGIPPGTNKNEFFVNSTEQNNSKGKTSDGYDTIGKPPSFAWVKTIGISGAEQATALAIDSLNHTLLSISLTDSMEFSGIRFQSLGGADVLLINTSYNGSGINWTRQIYTSPDQKATCTGIVSGSLGKFYVTGQFTGNTLKIDDKTLYRTGTQDFWLACFKSNGDCLWAINLPSTGSPNITMDSQGYLYLAGGPTFNKYNGNGTLIWSQQRNTIDFQKICSSDTSIYIWGILNAPDNYSGFYFDKNQTLLMKVSTSGEYLHYLRTQGVGAFTASVNKSLQVVKNGITNDFDVFISGVNTNVVNIFAHENSNEILYQSYQQGPYLYRFSEDLELKNTYEANFTAPPGSTLSFQMSPALQDKKNSYPYSSLYLIGNLSERSLDISLSFHEKIFVGSSFTDGINRSVVVNGGFCLQWLRTGSDEADISLDRYSYQNPMYAAIIPAFDNSEVNMIGLSNQTNPLLQYINIGADLLLNEKNITSSFGTASMIDVKTDPDCNQYILGSYSGIVNLLDKKLNGSGSYLAKVDAKGKVVWCDTIFGASPQKLGMDKTGNLWVLGTFNSTLVTSHGDFFINESGMDLFLTKYNKSGQIEVCKQYNGTFNGGGIWSYALTVDNLGNPVFGVKLTKGKIIFDQSHTIENTTYNAMFIIVKPNLNGIISWVISGLNESSSQSNNDLRSLATDSYNNIFGTGTYSSGTFTISGRTVNSRGVNDMFLIKLSSDGALLWLKSAGGSSQETDPYSVCTDKKGNSYVFCNGFNTDNPYYFESTVISPPSGWVDGILIAKYSQVGNLIWVKHFPAKTGIVCSFMKMDEKENLYLIGSAIYDSLKIDTRYIKSNSSRDWYIIKCNPEGAPLWVKTFANSNAYPTSIAVPEEDKVLFSGTMSAQTSFENIIVKCPIAGTPILALAGKELKACSLVKTFNQSGTIKCAQETGSGLFKIDGGTSPYIVNWKEKVIADKDTLYSLQTNKYYGFTVQDLRNCSLSDSITLNAPKPIQLEISTTECDPSLNNGTANVLVNGGVAPYSYLWSTGNSNTWDSKLAAGAYSVKVTDHNNCEKIGTFNINNLNAPKIVLNGITHTTCYGGSDGAIGIDVTDGNPPYKFKWSNGSYKEDQNNLKPGIYQVQAEDSRGLIATASFVVQQPIAMDVSVTVRNPDCGNEDGSAQVFTDGGIAPYSYLWSNGDTLSYTEHLPKGIYTISVSDKNGCQVVQKAILSEIGAPDIEPSGISYPSCGDSSGHIELITSGGSGNYNYEWSTGLKEADIYNIPAGDYYLKVTDSEYSCASIAYFRLDDQKPAAPSICMVTVDSLSNNIMVVIEPQAGSSIQYYNIYKESESLGDYTLLGSVPASRNTFIDSLSNPMQRPWKYRISAVDKCDNESELSIPHTTIHLTMNIGLANSVNLIWTKYEGFTVSTYAIWKFNLNNGWKMITQVSSDFTTNTDLNSNPEDILYYIELPNPNGCEILGPKGKTLNSTRSNRSAREKAYVMEVSPGSSDEDLALYPNPNNGSFAIIYNSLCADELQLKLINMSGTVIWIGKYTLEPGQNQIPMNTLGIPDGIYSLLFLSPHSSTLRKFIIQH